MVFVFVFKFSFIALFSAAGAYLPPGVVLRAANL